MKDPIKIVVSTVSPFRPLRVLYGAATYSALIGIGILVGSPAMQWAGFSVVAIIFVLAMIGAAKQHIVGMTIPEAREKLDRLEREAAE